MNDQVEQRQVRADHDDTSLVVYQAYAAEIADAALAAGTFVAPFSMSRMTWIKPSFLWMMYRCGWATKPGQERVLAVRITRAGLDEALSEAVLSHHDATTGTAHGEWQERLRHSQVRVQWDPERDVRLDRLPWRSLQVGLSGSAVERYVHEWIVSIDDVTATATQLHRLVTAGRVEEAVARLPIERPLVLGATARAAVGAA